MYVCVCVERGRERERKSVSFVGKGVVSRISIGREGKQSTYESRKVFDIVGCGSRSDCRIETAPCCPKPASGPRTDGLARYAFPQSRNLAIALFVIWKRIESRRCRRCSRGVRLLLLFFLFHLLHFFLLLLLPPETNSPETAETARGQLVSQSDVCYPIRLTRGALVDGISAAASMRTGVTLRGGAGER